MEGVSVHYCAISHQYHAVCVEEFRVHYCQLGNNGGRYDHYESGFICMTLGTVYDKAKNLYVANCMICISS